ncbi:MAG TPA: hypothetical protein VFG05_00315 [Methylocella sp.]|nr:hypothetical protein [Methylocella sp.]
MLRPAASKILDEPQFQARKPCGALLPGAAALLTLAIFASMIIPAAPVAQSPAPLPPIETVPADDPAAADGSGGSVDAIPEFIERVALSHVASLKTPPANSGPGARFALSGAPEALASPHGAAKLVRLSASKLRAAAAPTVQPPGRPAGLANGQDAVQRPSDDTQMEPLPPVQFGMRLVKNLGSLISASQTRVAEGVASVSSTLTSLVKKL